MIRLSTNYPYLHTKECKSYAYSRALDAGIVKLGFALPTAYTEQYVSVSQHKKRKKVHVEFEFYECIPRFVHLPS
ncbi:hypothetical protein RRG08_060451 [Elysia crispata]|uniref:Uncharacterized protein n=1 Tax=Elysia crispata TaxID=231223 RepID=A0AAE1B030_9GAST|nr:hypothetical protein RRG08_060451 [Elysia crispata]